MKKSLPILLAFLLFLILAGCNQNLSENQPGNRALEQIDDQSAPAPGTETPGGDQPPPPARNGAAPGQTRMQTNANLNRIQMTEKIRQIVREVNNFSLDSVMINGDDLWVFVHTNNQLPPRAIIKENAELHSRLKEEFPRFHIEVRVEESWQPPAASF